MSEPTKITEYQYYDVLSQLSAATQALTDKGYRLVNGVWSEKCPVVRCDGGQYTRDLPGSVAVDCMLCNGTGWLPITRPSGGEGGAG